MELLFTIAISDGPFDLTGLFKNQEPVVYSINIFDPFNHLKEPHRSLNVIISAIAAASNSIPMNCVSTSITRL